MFFTCIDLAKIDKMYQYSLQWFLDLFIESLGSAPISRIILERIENLKAHFMYLIFCNVCGSTFEKDKVMIAILILARVFNLEFVI